MTRETVCLLLLTLFQDVYHGLVFTKSRPPRQGLSLINPDKAHVSDLPITLIETSSEVDASVLRKAKH